MRKAGTKHNLSCSNVKLLVPIIILLVFPILPLGLSFGFHSGTISNLLYLPLAQNYPTGLAKNAGTSTDLKSTIAGALTHSSTIPVVGSSWTDIGPKPISNGFDQPTWGTAPFSGRITAIAVNNTNPSIVYVGGAQGGIWKSTNKGTTWTPIGDSFPSLAIGAIAISSDGKTLYVGTGEPNHSGDSYYGAGLLKSTDGGNTWSTLGGSVFSGSAISGILINSTNPSDLLVSTTWAECCRGLASSPNPAGLGIFRSINSGANWNLVLSPSSGNGVADLIGDPNNQSVAYAGGYSGEVWQTIDGGTVWSELPVSENLATNQGRVAVALSGDLPNTIFVAFANYSGGLIGIYKYNVSNGVITTLGTPPNPPGITPCGPAGETQCWYDFVLSVDPTNARNIYFGGVDLYSSNTGGSSWTDLGGYISGSSIHPDQHALVISPTSPGTIYEGNDGGLWYSTTYGNSWTDLNSGLGITQFQSIAASPTSDSLAIGGTQDNACVQYSGTSTWNELTIGDGGWTGIESTNSSIMYCVYTHLYVQKSNDSGSNWSFATTGINLSDSSLFYAPVAQDPNNPGTLYIGGTHVYKTINYASSWIDVSGSIGTSLISAIAVAPSNSSVVYLGDTVGDVMVSNNGGYDWTTIAKENFPISSIAVNITNYQTAYVALASYATPRLLKITNEGASLQTLPLTGFSNASIDVVKINPTSGDIFVGTDSGIFYSSDAGNTWSTLGTGLPNAAIFDIAFTHSNYVLAATHGRGVWEQPPIGDVSALTFSYSVHGGGLGYAAPTLSYVKNGVSTYANLTTSQVTYTADYGSSWNVSRNLPGSTFAERWQANQIVDGIAGSAQTTVFQYYHQYNATASFSVVDGGFPSAPTLTSTQFGKSYAPTLTTSPTTIWIDSGSTWTITNPLSGITDSERWMTQTSSGTVSSSSSISPIYYHEFVQKLSYTVVDGGILPSAPTASGMQVGTLYSPMLTTTPTLYWFDASGSITLTSIVPGQPNERWASQNSTIPATSSGTRNIDFYHQYSVSALYSVVGSGSGFTSPTLNYFANGTSSYLALTTQNRSLWADANLWSITNPIGGSNSTTRWYATGVSGTFSMSTTIDPAFYEQFMVEIESNSPSEGTVAPASGWFDSSFTINIYATPVTGYQFVSWTGTGSVSYSGSNSRQQITVRSPIVEVAHFIQSTSSSPTSSSQGSQQTNSGGLESLYLALIAALIVAVAAIAALVTFRKRG